MSEALDMSLDDIIRHNKSGGFNGNFRDRGRGRGRGRGGGSGPGPARRFPNRAPTRTTPYLNPQMSQVLQMSGMRGAVESETKLYVSNLDYGVTNGDIEVLFSEVGELMQYSIHYDRSGKSKGTAEVVFRRQSDALAAIKRYNNVQLDGKPMKIELVGVNIVSPVAMPLTTKGILGNPNGTFRRQVRDGGGGWEWDSHRGGGGGRGFGRGRGSGRGRGQNQNTEKTSAEDLDADLEKYHLEAMKIN